MILEELGVLDTAHALTEGEDAVSENVIDIGAAGISGPCENGQIWLEIETVVKAGGSTGSITFDLRIATAIDMTTGAISIMSVVVPAITDERVDAVGKKIVRCTVPMEAVSVARQLGSTYTYLGLYVTQSAASMITYNATLSTSKPETDKNVQVTRSNVSVPT